MDAFHQRVFQQFFSNQNFAQGQASNYSVSWTPGAVGTYTAKIGIFSAQWSNLLSWNDNAMQISVATANQANFTATGGVSPASLSVGQSGTLVGNVLNNGGAASNVIVMLEVANASGTNVFQQLFNGQNLASGQTQAYSASWTPSTPGTYTLNVGIFTANWSSLLGWVNGVAGTTVLAPAITASAVSAPAVDASSKFYVDPNSSAALAAVAMQPLDPTGASKLKILASQPTGVWFGDWNANIYQDVKTVVDAAASQGTIPILVAYNIPNRDCNGYSSGGAASASAYQGWIYSFANGIGSRKAIVILEPDALANISCLSQADQATRMGLLSSAITKLKSLGGTSVYLDAGNPNWIPAGTMAQRLNSANVSSADGFSVSVSNFFTTASDEQYGNQVSALAGNKHYVIDTGRNGNGPDANNNWCNPSGRAIGAFPTAITGHTLVDDFLWIKPPGESDGACNGGPSAGVFWPQYAIGLVEGAGL